ncbi:hypothetical protein, partial [Anaplasma capra]|uniref:hypothetical protein n=1 Tax=Anaplasma capra TaxID=1562740 RepID=UPI0021D5FA26
MSINKKLHEDFSGERQARAARRKIAGAYGAHAISMLLMEICVVLMLVTALALALTVAPPIVVALAVAASALVSIPTAFKIARAARAASSATTRAALEAAG